jgi:hypothetical protein
MCAKGIAQVVGTLPSKHEALNLNPVYKKKKNPIVPLQKIQVSIDRLVLMVELELKQRLTESHSSISSLFHYIFIRSHYSNILFTPFLIQFMIFIIFEE